MIERAASGRLAIREEIGDGEWHVLDVDEVLFEGAVGGHSVLVAQTKHGRTFVLDGRIQSCEADEHVYHEALTHVAMVAHPSPRHVVCVGGSTGAIVRELLRHPTVASVVFVEANGPLIELTRRCLPHLGAEALGDRRVRTFPRSLREWLVAADDPAPDVVILDPLEERAAGADLVAGLDAEGLALLRAKLDAGGIVCLAAGAARSSAGGAFERALDRLRAAFAHVVPFASFVPSLGTAWGFIAASMHNGIEQAEWRAVDGRLGAQGIRGLRHYDGRMHEAMRTLGTAATRGRS